jgi:hypothetical protein
MKSCSFSGAKGGAGRRGRDGTTRGVGEGWGGLLDGHGTHDADDDKLTARPSARSTLVYSHTLRLVPSPTQSAPRRTLPARARLNQFLRLIGCAPPLTSTGGMNADAHAMCVPEPCTRPESPATCMHAWLSDPGIAGVPGMPTSRRADRALLHRISGRQARGAAVCRSWREAGHARATAMNHCQQAGQFLL